MRIFIVGAIVLIVFAIIATATTGVNAGQLFGVWWYTWLCAALLSFFVDILVGWTWAVGPFVRRERPPV